MRREPKTSTGLTQDELDDLWHKATTKQPVEPYMSGYRAGWNDALEELEGLLDQKCAECGAVDGYDYNSGVEYGLRVAAIEAKKRKRA